MKLICYPTMSPAPALRPAPATRDWMDDSPKKFVYRCLPLAIANAHGWEVLCPAGFTARWNGGADPSDVTVEGDAPLGYLPMGHFGCGILTMHIGYLVRTEPGHDLFVTGPTNERRDGIAPLTGVVETDWSSYTFTMNWAFTRPGEVRFEAGDPFCLFFPIPRGLIESVEPKIQPMDDEPDLKRRFEDWSGSRDRFIEDLSVAGSDARRERWQKSYFQGRHHDGTPGVPGHRTRLRLPGWSATRTQKLGPD